MVILVADINSKMKELADTVRSKTGVEDLLSIDDMISIISDISNNRITYGYINEDGKFQRVVKDSEGSSIDVGVPETIDNLYVIDVNKPDPEY